MKRVSWLLVAGGASLGVLLVGVLLHAMLVTMEIARWQFWPLPDRAEFQRNKSRGYYSATRTQQVDYVTFLKSAIEQRQRWSSDDYACLAQPMDDATFLRRFEVINGKVRIAHTAQNGLNRILAASLGWIMVAFATCPLAALCWSIHAEKRSARRSWRLRRGLDG